MTRKEIVELLKIVIASYPNTKIADPTATVSSWEMMLGDYSAESVYKAARLHMATSKFFPSPSDIIEKIVRAELIYTPTIPNAIEAKASKDYDGYLDAFCKWIGFGYEPDDTVEMPQGFLPYEV